MMPEEVGAGEGELRGKNVAGDELCHVCWRGIVV